MRRKLLTDRAVYFGMVLVVLAGLPAACTTATATPELPPAPRLRIVNAGDLAIENLTVLFPDGELAFGDVAAGATTEYMHAPSGVYRYAAYRYEVDGEERLQPVIDWMGEAPMEGESFTYTIRYDPSQTDMLAIQLGEVTQDD